jgi:GNAT superfamily N-acetyltransferase
MSHPLSVRRFRGRAERLAAVSAWGELAHRCDAEVGTSAAWLDASLAGLSATAEPVVLLVHSGERAVAGWATALERAAHVPVAALAPAPRWTLLGGRFGEHPLGPLLPPSELDEPAPTRISLMSALVEGLAELWASEPRAAVELGGLPGDSALLPLLAEALQRHGLSPTSAPEPPAWRTVAQVAPGAHHRAIVERSALGVRVVTGARGELSPLLPTVFRLARHSTAARGELCPWDDVTGAAFVSRLASAAAAPSDTVQLLWVTLERLSTPVGMALVALGQPAASSSKAPGTALLLAFGAEASVDRATRFALLTEAQRAAAQAGATHLEWGPAVMRTLEGGGYAPPPATTALPLLDGALLTARPRVQIAARRRQWARAVLVASAERSRSWLHLGRRRPALRKSDGGDRPRARLYRLRAWPAPDGEISGGAFEVAPASLRLASVSEAPPPWWTQLCSADPARAAQWRHQLQRGDVPWLARAVGSVEQAVGVLWVSPRSVALDGLKRWLSSGGKGAGAPHAHGLFVLPQWRRQGVATALLRALRRPHPGEADGLGSDALPWTLVDPRAVAARRALEKAGWEALGDLDGWEPTGRSAEPPLLYARP